MTSETKTTSPGASDEPAEAPAAPPGRPAQRFPRDTGASLLFAGLLASAIIVPGILAATLTRGSEAAAAADGAAAVESVALSDSGSLVVIQPPGGWKLRGQTTATAELVRGQETMQITLLGTAEKPEVAWGRHVRSLAARGLAVAYDEKTDECTTINTATNTRGTCAYAVGDSSLLTVFASSPASAEAARQVIESASIGDDASEAGGEETGTGDAGTGAESAEEE